MRIKHLLSILCSSIIVVTLVGACPAVAKTKISSQQGQATFDTPTLPTTPPVSEDKPVMLTADIIEYDQPADRVIARGKVEVVQGDTILLCDTLTYDRKANTVFAQGNVSVMEQTGNVIFADEFQLKDDLKSGAAKQFMARLTDDSLFAAGSAVKVDEYVTEMEDVVYSPCKLRCDEDGKAHGDPLWQMRADKVRVDDNEQTVSYKNAQMELYGVPVFYTPYLSHATPNADNKSGIMAPEFGRNDNLGNVYKVPVYYAIAPDKDATITPIITSQEGLVMLGNYRQKFDNGIVTFDGSATRPRDRDAAGNPTDGKQFRGHVFSTGKFDAAENTHVGFDIRRTTDDTYMRRYDISDETQLTSRIYGESYDFIEGNDRNAISIEALSFQGLTAQDDSSRIPLILPMIGFNYESDPGMYDSRFFVDSNALVLSRDVGAQTRRLSNLIGWRLPYITDNGQVIEFTTQLRGDMYDVSDVNIGNNTNFDGVTGRLVPEVSTLWRYPFISQYGSASVMVEPVVGVAVSPNGGNPDKIPNEDSLVPEFTDTNLFSTNRFSGYDRIETGPRASYGLRGLVAQKDTYVDWLFGQHYRLNDDRNFPFSNDLGDHLSDYVGKLGLQYNPLYIAYRFRLDREQFSPRRNELDVTYGGNGFSFSTAYLSLKNDPILATREELYGSARVDVTKNWSLGMSARQDLLINQVTSVGGEIVFKNECINIANMISREYTRDRDVKPNTSFFVRVSLKNLN